MKFINKEIFIYINILKIILIFLLLLAILFFFHTKIIYNSTFKFLNKNEDIKVKMSLVIPINYRDFEKIKFNFKFYKKYIDGINSLVFIGDEKVGKLIEDKLSFFKMPLKFINEKVLLDVNKIKKLIKKRKGLAIRRSGWYIQQFLKMQYYKVCKDKYYLIWDSDTIPVKKVKMFNKYGKPYFDINKKFSKSYFVTMKKIFPELGKKYNYSFVSEHMIIKTEIMKELINRINKNKRISGYTWYEKIINCINLKDLEFRGFSEFETYGTFTNEYYRKTYDLRYWKSLRPGNIYYNYKYLTYNDIQNIARKYDAVSFENWK